MKDECKVESAGNEEGKGASKQAGENNRLERQTADYGELSNAQNDCTVLR